MGSHLQLLQAFGCDICSELCYIHIIWNLTLKGPCIVIYSYNKSQRDAEFLKCI